MSNRADAPDAEEPVQAPLMSVRRMARSMISYNAAHDLADGLVRAMPQAVLRSTERQLDFPISRIIRQAPLLLIRVPKTASVSLALQLYGRVSHVPHRTALFYHRADPAFFQAITSFAVVRDPVDRLRSAYRWLKRGGGRLIGPHAQTRRVMQRIDSFDSFVLDYLHPAFEAGRLGRLDATLHLQADYVCDPDGAVMVDHLFRFERIGEVQAFLRRHGIERVERRENTSSHAATPAAPLAPALEDVIRTIYAKDMALFGYR